jgi:hypothetical protein
MDGSHARLFSQLNSNITSPVIVLAVPCYFSLLFQRSGITGRLTLVVDRKGITSL